MTTRDIKSDKTGGDTFSLEQPCHRGKDNGSAQARQRGSDRRGVRLRHGRGGADAGAVERVCGEEDLGLTGAHVGGDVATGACGGGGAGQDLDYLVVGREAADAELVVGALAALVVDAEDDLAAALALAQAQVVDVDQDLVRDSGDVVGRQLDGEVAQLVQLGSQVVQRRGRVVLGGPDWLTVEGRAVAAEVLLLTLVDCSEHAVSGAVSHVRRRATKQQK